MKKLNQNPNHKLNQANQRQQKGNTLVPVVIGLAIAAIATVAFLNQGEGLIADNNRVLATNEIAGILANYNTIRATGVAAANVTAAQVPGLTANNVYGNPGNWVNPPAFSYTADEAASCQQLAATFTGADGVAGAVCNAVTPAQLDLTLN